MHSGKRVREVREVREGGGQVGGGIYKHDDSLSVYLPTSCLSHFIH